MYYQRQNNTKYKKYSYLNSAVPPNESCPTGKKMCGILDNLGNKLCYPKSLDCPLNYITTNKSELKYSTYGSTSLGTKTIYFSNQATKNGKIIGGLFVDSDLMIKYNDEDCEILEEGTVRKLLDSHPYKLYRKSLSYDPYKKVKNEKSYLKWCVPGVGKEKKISKIKELNIEYKYNITTNKNIINPIKISIGKAYFVSLPGYIGLFLFVFIVIPSFFEINEINFPIPGCSPECDELATFFLFVIFVGSFVLIIIGTIFDFKNIGTISLGNELKLGKNIISSLKGLNIYHLF